MTCMHVAAARLCFAPFAAMVRKVRHLLANPVGDIDVYENSGPLFQLEIPDLAVLKSLYRSALLLTLCNERALDLVASACRNVAALSCRDSSTNGLRMLLFQALHSAFEQSRGKYEFNGGSVEASTGNSGEWQLIRNFIHRQDPQVRLMIFLRHSENLSLTQISSITGKSAEAVKLCLLEFRNGCRSSLCAASHCPALEMKSW